MIKDKIEKTFVDLADYIFEEEGYLKEFPIFTFEMKPNPSNKKQVKHIKEFMKLS